MLPVLPTSLTINNRTIRIHRKYDFGNGQILDGFDICGLRFSKVKPYDWQEEYSLQDYIYFEAIPIKEKSDYRPQKMTAAKP